MPTDKSSTHSRRLIAQNKKAWHNYHIEETMEAGIVLMGSEVKSLRYAQCSLNEAYVAEEHGTLHMMNAHIPEYTAGVKAFSHAPRTPRKLLLHKKQARHLSESIQRKGMTIVPLKIYFNARGLVKVEIGLAKGKHKADKRDSVKQRDWQRQKARLLKHG